MFSFVKLMQQRTSFPIGSACRDVTRSCLVECVSTSLSRRQTWQCFRLIFPSELTKFAQRTVQTSLTNFFPGFPETVRDVGRCCCHGSLTWPWFAYVDDCCWQSRDWCYLVTSEPPTNWESTCILTSPINIRSLHLRVSYTEFMLTGNQKTRQMRAPRKLEAVWWRHDMFPSVLSSLLVKQG